jgi:ATP-dependent RNA helicase DHX57
MGPNRQPRSKEKGGSLVNRRNVSGVPPGAAGGRGGGGGGRGRSGASFHQRRKAFFTSDLSRKGVTISQSSREMIIDVLSHVATGGETEVSEKHFDPASAAPNIVFRRNAQLTPQELLQLYFERNGMPPDVTTQFIAEIDQTPTMPVGFTNMMELERDHTSMLRRSLWDIFAMMVWNHELVGGADSADRRAELANEPDDDDGDEGLAELREQMREEEFAMLEMMFGDEGTLLKGPKLPRREAKGKKSAHPMSDSDSDDGLDDDDDDVEYVFARLVTKDSVDVALTIKLLPHYPHDPPLVQVTDSMRALAPTTLRAIYDAAVDAIAAMKGTSCISSIISACRDTLGQVNSVEAKPKTPAEIEKAAEAERAKRAEEGKAKNQRRQEFVQALTGKEVVNEDGRESSAAAMAKNLPQAVQYEAVTVAEKKELQRETYLRRDRRLDTEMQQQWDRLQKNGKLMPRRRELPAAQMKATICDTLDKSQVIVVSGETGSGKTTQVPQFVLEHEIEQGRGSGANIICTQPRRLAATAVAIRVAEERDEEIGGTVGYSIRLENRMSSRTKLMYCTTGILLRKLQMDPFIGDVSHVIVDEIHERGVDTDFLLIILRDLLQKRPRDLKVVLMSATMDAELFSNYFHGAPCLHIPGRTFPVQRFFLEDIVEMTRYRIDDSSPFANAADPKAVRMRNKNKNKHLSDIDAALEEFEEELELENAATDVVAQRRGPNGGPAYSQETLLTVARMNPDMINYELIDYLVEYIDNTYRFEGAILIFLPGLAEIQRCIDELRSNRNLNSRCVFHNLHSSLGSSEQSAVFNRPPRGKRKVVVGTNIMETSITIDDAVFVIDCGKFKENRYDAKRSMSQLVTCWIAKSNASQRQGRAGRVREGFCFRLYTEAQFEKLRDHQICEMHRVPLESLVLQITLLNLGDEMEYLSKALSPPEERAVKASVNVLKSLGALTDEKRLTSLGYHLASLPLDVRIGKMIIHGALLRCLDPVLTIAACLSVKSPFLSSTEDQSQIEGIKKGFSGDYRSDQLAAWFAYLKWRSTLEVQGESAAKKLIWDAFLSSNALSQLQATKKQYERYLCESGFISEDAPNLRRRGTGYTHFAFDPYVTLDGICYESGGAHYNENSQKPKCILSCLMAGLYPNVARVVRRPKFNGIVGIDGAELIIHPSSVNSKHEFPQPFVVFVDKVKTSQTFLRETSMVSPYTLLLFGGPIQFLDNYSEIAVGNFVSMHCNRDDGILLSKLREQLDSTLRAKINDPTLKWESTSSHIVSAIVKLLTEEGSSSSLAVIDRSGRQPLSKPFLQGPSGHGGSGGGGGPRPGPQAAASSTEAGKGDGAAKEDSQPKQKYYTSRECFNCGQVGHLSRDCKADKRLAHHQGGPTVRCFICGLKTHHPPQCPMTKQPKPSGGSAGSSG